MNPGWIIVIYVIGLLAIVVEMFLPGVVVGTIGFLIVCGAIIYAYVEGHALMGTVMMGVTVAMIPLFFVVWRNVLGRVWSLRASIGGTSTSPSEGVDLVGKEGVAASLLRPSGVAIIEGKRRAVVTRGEVIEKGTQLKVIDVTGNRVVVKKT